MKGIIGYFHALFSPQFAPTGIKVAVIVGTILLTINHGYAIISCRMTSDRWLAALLTYRKFGLKPRRFTTALS
jgi:hypothetical protein